MIGLLERALMLFARKTDPKGAHRGPVLVELLESSDSDLVESYPNGLFRCDIRDGGSGAGPKNFLYEIVPVIGAENLALLRAAVGRISESLSPEQVKPLSFTRL